MISPAPRSAQGVVPHTWMSAAGAFSLWIIEDKAASVQAILEVNLHAQHVHRVLLIHDKAQTIKVIYLIIVFCFVKAEQIAHARAAAALHPNAQAVFGGHFLFFNDISDLHQSPRGEADGSSFG